MNHLSVRRVAERLGVSAGTVYGLCAARKLRHVRVGLGRGRLMVPEDALDEFLQSRTVESTEPARKPSAPKADRSAGTFTELDTARLLTAWRQQGVVADPPE